MTFVLRCCLLLTLFCHSARGQQTPIYINCGATAPYEDTGGRTWIADSPFVSTGNVYATDSAIEETEDDPLYQNERYFMTNEPYNFMIPVAATGDYSVKLHFAEIYFTDAGNRIFDVYLQGNRIAEDFDVIDAALGPFTAFTLSNVTTVSDGYLNITLVKKVNHPKISGIEICQQVFPRRLLYPRLMP